jgi:hypothetical protein
MSLVDAVRGFFVRPVAVEPVLAVDDDRARYAGSDPRSYLSETGMPALYVGTACGSLSVFTGGRCVPDTQATRTRPRTTRSGLSYPARQTT